MIELYINGKKADLTGSETVLYNKTRTDYTNPTIIKNSFTKTVTLPGTVVNDGIFGHMEMDYRKVKTDGSNFNPSKRNPFVLCRDGVKVEEGYIVVDKVIRNVGAHSYDCTLYGSLGNVLYSLSYDESIETGAQNELNMGSLFDENYKFNIDRYYVKKCWSYAFTEYGKIPETYRPFSFMVSYDGVPKCDNFDSKSMWVSVKNRRGAVIWDGQQTTSSMPEGTTKDDVYYGYLSTMVTKLAPDDRYGLITFSNEIMPAESRDLRSYLLRPVIRLRWVVEKIGEFLQKKTGYTLDTSDWFFRTSDYLDTYITLPMLYESYPDIESNYEVHPSVWLKDMPSPASYLISLCKTYGLYLDTDIRNETLTLRRTPDFFLKDEILELTSNLTSGAEVRPLSFDKNSYTFDWGSSKGENLESYKEKYDSDYGSMKVYTGYAFDDSTQQYIRNNIFKTGVDTVEQGGWYRYNVYNSALWGVIDNPKAVMAEISTPKMKFFEVDPSTHLPKDYTSDINTYETEIYRNDNVVLPNNNWGYMFPDAVWKGNVPGVFTDYVPRLQLHKDRKGVDGSNILVRISPPIGKLKGRYGQYSMDRETESVIFKGTSSIYWNLSDDEPYLKNIIGKNCWFDNPDPDMLSSVEVIKDFPNFTRFSYDYRAGEYRITSTPDFSYPKEIYVPGGVVSGTKKTLYNTYWKDFVGDLYNIGTRVMTVKGMISDIRNAFRKFYTYNNCLWILSKVVEYDIYTHLGKFEFIKVNDIMNYSYAPGIYVGENNVGCEKTGGEIRIPYREVGSVKWALGASVSWMTVSKDEKSKDIVIQVQTSPSGTDRTAYIYITDGGQYIKDTIVITQYGG